MSCSCSYITMDSDKLRALCEEKIESIKRWRQDIRDREIAERIQSREKLRRWLPFLKPLTAEIINHEINCDVWHVCHAAGGLSLMTARDLLKATQLATSVNVSVDDLDCIVKDYSA